MRVLGLSIFLKRGYTEQTKNIVMRYWNRADDGTFTEDVAAMGKEIGESPVGLLEYIRSHSSTCLKDITCPSCSEEIYVDCRSSYLKYMRQRKRACDSCRSGRVREYEDEGAYVDSDDSSGGVEPSAETQETSQCSVETEGVQVAAPVRVFSGLMIPLSDFVTSPAETVAACQGATLAVVKDGVPLFYCVSPDVMAKQFDKDSSTS